MLMLTAIAMQPIPTASAGRNSQGIMKVEEEEEKIEAPGSPLCLGVTTPTVTKEFSLENVRSALRNEWMSKRELQTLTRDGKMLHDGFLDCYPRMCNEFNLDRGSRKYLAVPFTATLEQLEGKNGIMNKKELYEMFRSRHDGHFDQATMLFFVGSVNKG